MCLELYKVVADKPLEALRDGFVNLAINMVSVVEPKPPKKTVSVVRALSSFVVVFAGLQCLMPRLCLRWLLYLQKFDPTFRGPLRAIPEGFTSWDKIVIQCADKTVQEVIDDIQVHNNSSSSSSNQHVPCKWHRTVVVTSLMANGCVCGSRRSTKWRCPSFPRVAG